MKEREIIAYHGWGFSSLFWKEWQEKILAAWSCYERGYFSKETGKEPFFRSKDSYKMVFAHSLGLHFISEKVFSALDLLVIFAGFAFFHEEQENKTKAILTLMKQKLAEDPGSLLKKFYQNCGQPDYPENFSALQTGRLLEDLFFLDGHHLDVSLMQGKKKVLIFHGKEDRIVSPSLGEGLHQSIAGSSFFLLKNAGHVFSKKNQEESLQMMQNHIPDTFKEKVRLNFSKASSSYSSSACFAALSVGKLIELLLPLKNSLPDGPILEIGAGTGFVSKRILPHFPTKKLIFSDLSSSMIEECKEQLSYDPFQVSFCVKDGESMEEKEEYSLILSGMTLQWCEDVEGALHRWFRALKKGGYLLFSFLGGDSFTEWERLCEEKTLPFTINPLPDLQQLRSFLSSLDAGVHVEEKLLSIPFPNVRSFFTNLKETGAHASKGKKMSWKDRKKLLSFCQEKQPLNISYQIGFALLKKR